MLRLARGRLSALAGLITVLLVVTGPAAGQARSRTSGPGERVARAADTVLGDGLEAKIPPHVSEMLGISAALKDCPVKQRYQRDGTLVRGFEVSLTNHNDVVLFVADEGAKEQTYYLTSRLGRLRRVLAVREGVGHVWPVNGKQKAAFDKELHFWLARIVPDRTAK